MLSEMIHFKEAMLRSPIPELLPPAGKSTTRCTPKGLNVEILPNIVSVIDDNVKVRTDATKVAEIFQF